MRYIYYVIIAILLLSCEEDLQLDDLLTSGNQIPTTHLATETIDSSTVNLTWSGNDFATLFSYRLEPLSYLDTVLTYTGWSIWDSLETVTFKNLDDGDYNFHIKSRFTTDIEEAPQEISFTVNAIDGPALRIYPLYQQVQAGSSFDFYIYVEDAVELAGVSLDVSYNANQLSFDNLTQGEPLLNASIFLDETNTTADNGTIDIVAIAEDFATINGTKPLAKFTMTANSTSLLDTILINTNSILRNSGNVEIDIQTYQYGLIEVVE